MSWTRPFPSFAVISSAFVGCSPHDPPRLSTGRASPNILYLWRPMSCTRPSLRSPNLEIVVSHDARTRVAHEARGLERTSASTQDAFLRFMTTLADDQTHRSSLQFIVSLPTRRTPRRDFSDPLPCQGLGTVATEPPLTFEPPLSSVDA